MNTSKTQQRQETKKKVQEPSRNNKTKNMDKTQELAGVSPVFGTRGLTNAKSRNSWAQQHERRKSIRLLGNVVELDEWLDWRLKWGQRGAAASQFVCLLFYTLNNVFFGNHNSPLLVATLLFFVGFPLRYKLF